MADLKEFQTLAVGSIGFLGVIMTLIVNAHLARKARRETIDHDRRLIRIALREELKIIQSAFKSRIQTIDEAEADANPGILVPLTAMTNVYDRLLDQLGLLTSAEVSKVMGAYLAVQQLPERLMLLRRREREETPGFISVDSSTFRAIREVHVSYLNVVSEAVRALEHDGGKS
jgi:hypothetical protein